jgi:hypothetical protein
MGCSPTARLGLAIFQNRAHPWPTKDDRLVFHCVPPKRLIAGLSREHPPGWRRSTRATDASQHRFLRPKKFPHGREHGFRPVHVSGCSFLTDSSNSAHSMQAMPREVCRLFAAGCMRSPQMAHDLYAGRLVPVIQPQKYSSGFIFRDRRTSRPYALWGGSFSILAQFRGALL